MTTFLTGINRWLEKWPITRRVDLDALEIEVEAAIKQWSTQLGLGRADPYAIMREVQALRTRLKSMPYYSVREARLAQLRIRTDMFLATLQEVALPWQGSRDDAALRTYDELLNEVFRQGASRRFPEDYAALLVRQAVLLREADRLYLCEPKFHQLQGLLGQIQEKQPVLWIACRCQELHTLAVQGLEDDWAKLLEEIKQHVEALQVAPADKAKVDGIVTYAEGVGYKRFMWQRRHAARGRDARDRQRYAEMSAHLLESLQSSPQGVKSVHNINLYHASMPSKYAAPELEASTIDALAWCNPKEALERAQALRSVIAELYPSLGTKADAQIRLIQSRLK